MIPFLNGGDPLCLAERQIKAHAKAQKRNVKLLKGGRPHPLLGNGSVVLVLAQEKLYPTTFRVLSVLVNVLA